MPHVSALCELALQLLRARRGLLDKLVEFVDVDRDAAPFHSRYGV
jgi:hypothetical protein